jgi:hypothetical protein
MSDYAPTRRTFFGMVAAFIFAGLAGKKPAVAAVPPTPQPLSVTSVWYLDSPNLLPNPAGTFLPETLTYSPTGDLLTMVDEQGHDKAHELRQYQEVNWYSARGNSPGAFV